MGCFCNKPSENNNVNLDPIKISERKEKDESTKHADKENNILEDNLNFTMKNNNLNTNNDVNQDMLIRNEDGKLDESQINPKSKKKTDKASKKTSNVNDELLNILNDFRTNPSKLGDIFIEEIKNITTNSVNGKETYLYKGSYFINGNKDLFIKVSEKLKSLNPMKKLEYKSDLEILLNQQIIPKNASPEEKKKLKKENEDDIKNKYKQLKKEKGSTYKNVTYISHTMNDNVFDSLLMQVVSNFNAESNNSKINKPFEIIFNENLNNIGISLSGKKKLSGIIVFSS